MQKTKRLLAFILMMVLMTTQLPLTASGDDSIDTGFSAAAITAGTNAVTVTDFEELPDDVRWQNTTAPAFPETVTGAVYGTTELIPITWEADHHYDADSPESGLYVFTARADEGYTVADGVELPRITVYIPPMQRTMLRMASTAPNAHIVITTAAQLEEIAVLVNQGRLESFILNDSEAAVILRLGNDMDLSAYGANWNGGKGWIPIGASKPFKSHFDGNGRTITGLYINDSTLNCAGLFGNLSDNGVVSGLTLTSVNINAGMFVGSIAGNVSSGKIQDCHVSGMVKGTVFVGGIAGQTFSFITGNNTIVRCASDVAVNGEFWVGGIVGGMLGDIETESLMQNCYAAGSVSGFSAIGGLAGIVGQGCRISNCYATGSVTAENIAGGIAGLNYGTIQDSVALNPSVDLNNTSGETDCGRIAGENDTGILLNNAAYRKMFMNINGTRRGSTSDAAGLDGADLTLAEINADGSIGGRFTTDAGWAITNGKLPGFGTTVEIPAYINDINDHYFRGSGTENDPFLIETAEQLKTLAELVNSSLTNANYGGQGVHYKLVNDIDLSAYGPENTGFNEGKGWVPIGINDSIPFAGTFDGNGKTIRGMYINDAWLDRGGLFGFCNTASIKNLILMDVNITAHDSTGGLVGYLSSNGTVDSCFVSGTVRGNSKVGGIVGYLGGTITQSVSAVDVFGEESVGGLVGFYIGKAIRNCYSSGKVIGFNGTSDYYGTNIGGFIGQALYGEILACYSISEVSGNLHVGGLVGYIESYPDVRFISCLALNPVVRGNDHVEPIVAQGSGYVDNTYMFDGIKNGSGVTLAEGGFKIDYSLYAIYITADELMIAANLPADFHNAPWTVADGYLPGLFGKPVEMPDHILAEAKSAIFTGSGDENDPWQISTPEQLAMLARLVNMGNTNLNNEDQYYILVNDINLSGYDSSNTGFNGGRGWVPIGTTTNPFKGHFSGEGHTITGLYINNNAEESAGLFGVIDTDASVANLGITNASISGGRYVGGIAGVLSGMEENCFVTGNLSGTEYVGGIAGIVSNTGKVQNCYSKGSITGTPYAGSGLQYVGGITGAVENTALLQNCYSTASVAGMQYAGGIAGAVLNSGRIADCAALNPSISGADTGRVTGSTDTGGTLAGNYAFSNMTGGGRNRSADGTDGADASPTAVKNTTFWTTGERWDTGAWDASAWSFENDRLPILKGFADGIQSGDSGLYFMAKDIAYATVDIGGPYTYNGSPIIIGMAVAFDGQTLEAGKDYSFSIVDAGGSSISDIVDAGTYHVMLAGLNDFTGTKDVPFNIVAKDLPTEDNITVVDGPFTYNGTAHEPEVTVTDGDKTFAKNVDFTVSYEDNIAAGTATVIVTGTGNYQGIRKVPFTIGKRPVTVKADDKTMISGDKLPTFTYTVEEQLPGENALDGIPVLTCETDGRITGQYPIKVDLTAVSYTSNYTAANPGFINGTLTVYPTPFIPPAGSYDSSDESKNVPEETPKAETTVSGNIMTGVTTKKAVINSKGNATAVFGWAQATDVINKAAEEAGKQGEGYTARVEFRVEAPDNVATVETILPKDAVSQALKYGISALTISTPIASITFDADTLSTLSEEAAGQIKVTASRVETSSLSPEVQQQIGDRPVFDFSVTSGNKVISQFRGNVTVSVPYSPKEGEDTNAIVIYYINAEGELEIVKNCVYDPETGTIRFATNHFSMYAVGYNKVDFKDVPVTAWYGNAVTFIAARGITAGTGGGNFSPEAKLTRGQFIVMLMRAYEIDPDTNITDNFADAGDIWYTGYLAAAKRLGISNGIGNNMFGPDREITRQEVFTLLYNTLRILGKLPGSSSGKSLSSFSDVEDIASWAKEAISYLVETGIINDSGGKLLPTETSTRAQMTQVLYNLMNQ